MGIVLYQEPTLEKPDMIVSWPGIGNIGVIAVDTLRGQVRAEQLGEIEPWDFFYPQKVLIRDGVMVDLEFPTNKFYFQRQVQGKDLIFFLGEEQPSLTGRLYAEGQKAYQMANLVMDVAERFRCGRIYTSGAAVALTHHTMRSRVWAVANQGHLIPAIKRHENTLLMSELESRSNHGTITGLNGLLLGVAKKRGVDAICLMGEIPDYLSQAPFPYPRASRSVLEVLSSVLGIGVDGGILDSMITQVDEVIENIYEQFPAEIKERIEHRKSVLQEGPEVISQEDEKWLKEHIDEFFKKGGKGA